MTSAPPVTPGALVQWRGAHGSRFGRVVRVDDGSPVVLVLAADTGAELRVRRDGLTRLDA